MVEGAGGGGFFSWKGRVLEKVGRMGRYDGRHVSAATFVDATARVAPKARPRLAHILVCFLAYVL